MNFSSLALGLSLTLCSSLSLFAQNVEHNSDEMGFVKVSPDDGHSIFQQFSYPNTVYELQGRYDLNGKTLCVPSCCRVIGSSALISNGTLQIQNGSEISNCSFINARILIADASNVRICDCFFDGPFSSSFLAEQHYDDSAIYAASVTDSSFENISIRGYRWGITIIDSFRTNVENVVFSGALDGPMDFSIDIANANYHDAVHLSNTHNSRICNVSANKCGACVLLGRYSRFNTIESCRGDILWDNGIYISSGDYNIVQNCSFNNVRGTGIKARGSCNIISNNTVCQIGVGLGLTGNGDAIGQDEFESDYNGVGSIANGNIVVDAHNYGIAISEHDGLPPYHFTITNNNIINGPDDGASIYVFCNGASVIGNNILCPNSLGVVIAQQSDKVTGGYLISDNNIICKRKGIVLQKCKNSVVSNNIVNADDQGILVYATEGSSFITNKFSGKGLYSVRNHIAGTTNFFKTLGMDDALVPSPYIILEK